MAKKKWKMKFQSTAHFGKLLNLEIIDFNWEGIDVEYQCQMIHQE